MIHASRTAERPRRLPHLMASLALVITCASAGLAGCSGNSTATGVTSQTAETSAMTDASIAQQLLAIDGVVSVEKYSNSYIEAAGFAEKYEIYEVVFEQAIDHSDPSVGSFEQHVRLFYADADALTIVNTDGYMLTDVPATAYRKFFNQGFFDRYGTPNIIQPEYRYFGSSVPEGLSNDSADLWSYLTMEQAATDFHDIVQKLSGVLGGKRLWTGTSKGGLTTDYQCYFQEQHGYNDADAFVAFCAPLCETSSDSRFMDAVYGEIGYAAYGDEQASEWHDLMDRFQLACIKHRKELQARYYQQAIEGGNELRESYFGSDEKTQAERLWDVAVNEFPVLGFWQYSQSDVVDQITRAIDEDDPDQIYACVVAAADPSSFSYNDGFLAYEIQAATEMGDYTENFDHLRALVATARNAAADGEKDAYYVATEGNPSYCAMYLSDEQSVALPYDSTTRNALVDWLNTTNTAHLVMISGQSDPWYFVRPELTFENSQIKCFESTYNHRTAIDDLSEGDQAAVWQTLDGWLKNEVL